MVPVLCHPNNTVALRKTKEDSYDSLRVGHKRLFGKDEGQKWLGPRLSMRLKIRQICDWPGPRACKDDS